MTRKYLKHTLESCRIAAAEHPTRAMLSKKNPRVYDAALRQGWLDELYPPDTRPVAPPAWTRERVAKVAKLYETRSAMRSGPHQHAYNTARKNGWLDVLPIKAGDAAFKITGIPAHPLRNTYLGMLARCTMPSNKNYDLYGGRGIQVCARWTHGENGANGFECFVADIGDRPGPNHSIDRKDNNRNYAPDNCRWATDAEQVQNSTSAKLTASQVAAIKFSTLKTGKLAKLYGVSPKTIRTIRAGIAWANIDHTHLVL
jgi:hypothetical protein